MTDQLLSQMQSELQSQLNKMSEQKTYLRQLTTDAKKKVIMRLSKKIKTNISVLLELNKMDLFEYKNNPFYQKAFEDRLTLTESRLQQMAEGLETVAGLMDLIGEIVEEKTLENGLHLKKVRAPLGLIFLIFESRPNVITEAFSLAFLSGNGLILKGGKESKHTSQGLYRLIYESLLEEKIKSEVFWGIEDTSRMVTDFLMQQDSWIDVLIPRGGEALIEYVTEHSRIPIIKNDRGLCHLYVHSNAELEMALNILVNAKTQRPGVCNSIETLLVDESIAVDFLLQMYPVMLNKGVEFFVCEASHQILLGKASVFLATQESFKTEYLDLKLNIKLVSGLEEALQHIERYGSRHSEAIITSDAAVAKHFESFVDAAVVYWNASTRFTDGGQFGMGGEIGISTQKLQVRGPVGMEALTSSRWIVEGQGQTRK